jgi:hypothetical protein
MAFSNGRQATESVSFKRYIGLTTVNIQTINPTKAELEKLQNREIQNEFNYVGEVEINGNKVPNARIDVYIKGSAEDNNGIEVSTKMTFFISNSYKVNMDGKKVQVIDKYGRTAWVTKEELQAHAIPQYSNGPANLDADYRPLFRGEEELTTFFKNFLNIPDVMYYKDNAWHYRENLEECECRFEDLSKLFKGDFSEILSIWKLQESNKIKVLLGVRTVENKMYQDVYTRGFVRATSNSTKLLEKMLAEDADAGRHPNSQFSVEPVSEYVVQASNPVNTAENPFAPAGNPAAFAQPTAAPVFGTAPVATAPTPSSDLPF